MSNVSRQPVLSIVIANYNYGRFLEPAISSVLQQCDRPRVDENGRVALPVRGVDDVTVELIICDAKSSDNSLEIIKKYDSFITWWCSEKDGGQSSAFNKGFSHSMGQYLTWLNADEEYLPGTFTAFWKKVNRNPSAKWVTGNLLEFKEDTREITRVSWGPHFQPFFLRGNHASIAVFGPSSFIRKDLYQEIGPINERFHYSMDLEYWARITLAGIPQTRLNYVCWAFGIHPDSVSLGEMTPEKLKAGRAENRERETRLGYTYKNKCTNPWYLLWMFCRIIDGSLFVRAWKRMRYIGKHFPGCMSEGASKNNDAVI